MRRNYESLECARQSGDSLKRVFPDAHLSQGQANYLPFLNRHRFHFCDTQHFSDSAGKLRRVNCHLQLKVFALYLRNHLTLRDVSLLMFVCTAKYE
ncbi:hypothetical protein TNIN_211821 [Trichonephila inaurata madagascariensis]|uniref:Uncharacterized protein n=1 Tax=Trichonephila inaurata madagascariensis TaxID=2747483 RepID=A0A8X6X7J2_9ARAC|nr:hypothetical protein TNIN_211821 [Trichonephila inaurata madagascariensis]